MSHAAHLARPDAAATLEDQQRELTRRLEKVRAQNAHLGNEQKGIEAEIACMRTSLDARRRLPLAKTVVASPCDVPWATMAGDDRMRFCKSCEKHVHNLSAMTSTEVEAFLETNANGNACVNLYERIDGTILTADCPVGVKRRRTRGLLLSVLGAGACSLFAFTAMATVIAAMGWIHPPAPPAAQIIEVPGPTVHAVGPSVLVPTIPDGRTKLPAAPSGMGWVLVHGPEGTRVFEGNRLLGATPLVITLPAGPHSLRAEGTQRGKNWSEAAIVIDLPSAGTADVAFKGPFERVPMPGGMRGARLTR